jgi:hypothetical protein
MDIAHPPHSSDQLRTRIPGIYFHKAVVSNSTATAATAAAATVRHGIVNAHLVTEVFKLHP